MRGKGAGYPSIRLVVAIFQHKKKNKRCTSRGKFPGDEKSAARAFGGDGEADGDDAAAKGVVREGGGERGEGQKWA